MGALTRAEDPLFVEGLSSGRRAFASWKELTSRLARPQ